MTAGPGVPAPLDGGLAAIGALHDPVRRSLYRYVAAQPGDVSRDQAAEAVGIQRALAAFHLDKLVEAGLLEASFRRLTGRTGPGAGRPAKVYRRSSSDHAVSVPPRTYDVAAELLAQAMEESGDGPAGESLTEVSHRFGRQVGEQVRTHLGGRASRERRMAALVQVLSRYGYEPRREGRAIRLANCPFHGLAERHRELVCGMNLHLLEGVVEGMGGGGIEARPEPTAGECCVTAVSKSKKG